MSRWKQLATAVRSRQATSVASGAILTLFVWLLSHSPFADGLREQVWDNFLGGRRGGELAAAVTIVDIDRAALEQVGHWPWSRERLASLVDAIAAARPKVLAVDILLIGQDERSPGTLARRLAAASEDASVAAVVKGLAERFPDSDEVLAAALRKAPAVLGTVLDPDGRDELPKSSAPVLVSGRQRLGGLWREDGITGALPILAEAAKGSGVLSLPGDADASVRRVPLLTGSERGLHPGFALEVARLTVGSSSYLLGGSPLALQSGPLRIKLAPDGMLRLRPRRTDAAVPPRMSAIEVARDASKLEGRIVLLGSSAPEVGGLRPYPFGRLQATVQIQAEAVEQILAGDAPVRMPGARWGEPLAAFAAALLAIAAALRLAPLPAGMLAGVIAAGWFLAAWLFARGPGLLLDPILVPASAAIALAGASGVAAAITRHREALIRRRFEQHLAPAVVQRIVEQPELLKLRGESRIVTALFTDIEAFTAMTERADPTELVSLLDRYFEGTSRIVVDHGGMIEKIVGDALHCIFNAPLDVPEHPRRALDCALALRTFTEKLRQEPDAGRLGLGRTRIGLETGRVVVGDVGGGRKLDYTAHGNAMNRAARLEAANKELGTSICVGSGAAALIDAQSLRSLGAVTLRGVDGALMVYEPWPEAMSMVDRDAYSAAMAALAMEPDAAISRLRALALALPGDQALQRLLERVTAGAQG